jgi:hypothetical protein
MVHLPPTAERHTSHCPPANEEEHRFRVLLTTERRMVVSQARDLLLIYLEDDIAMAHPHLIRRAAFGHIAHYHPLHTGQAQAAGDLRGQLLHRALTREPGEAAEGIHQVFSRIIEGELGLDYEDVDVPW